MTEQKRQFTADDINNNDDLAKLPSDQIVTAGQLRMKPAQRLADKAKELGVTLTALRMWHTEWKGPQYDRSTSGAVEKNTARSVEKASRGQNGRSRRGRC